MNSALLNIAIDDDDVPRVTCNTSPDCSSESCLASRAMVAQSTLSNITDTELKSSRIQLANMARQHALKAEDLEAEAVQTKTQAARYARLVDYFNRKEEEEAAKKAAYEVQQKAKARDRILEQVQSLSAERLADLLVEQGVSQVGPKEDTPLQILSEAFSTLQASFWIKSKENDVIRSITAPWMTKQDEKGLVVRGYDNTYKVIGGVCSVGALALAKAMLDETPLAEFTATAKQSRSVTLATHALAWALRDLYPDKVSLAEAAHSQVITWNDAPETTREEVLKVWSHAFKSPFLDVKDDESLYYLRIEGSRWHGMVFRSENEAKAALELMKDYNDTSDPLLTWFRNRFDYLTHVELVERLTKAEINKLAIPAPLKAMV